MSRVLTGSAMVAASWGGGGAGVALGLAVGVTTPGLLYAQAGAISNKADWADSIWDAARKGDSSRFDRLVGDAPLAELPESMKAGLTALRAHFAAREEERAKKVSAAREELGKRLAETESSSISKALVSAMELYDLATDKRAVLSDSKIVDLIARADAAAHEAEARGQWLTASELFVRLQLLVEETPQAVQYKEDSERVSHRLAMLRMYVPKRLWELQNERKIAVDGKPLPAYNPAGDDYTRKLAGITSPMVVDGLTKAAFDHVDLADYRRILMGALDGVRTLLTTTDLKDTFPGLADEQLRRLMLESIDRQERAVREDATLDQADCDRILRQVLAINDETVKLPRTVVMHEFGNGGISSLDEFTAIIWPYELARFNKMTQGSFVGVGVQIEFDETSNVRVVTPLDGTPAHKAGIKAGDVITKVNGTPIFGVGLDQVVDLITGPRGSPVTVTVERKDPGAAADASKKEIAFELTRDRIEVASVKGWKRSGAGEHAWDWMLDKEAKIGYVRLAQFTETTSSELERAVAQLRAEGARGLVLDLRFNPGGLLDQAIRVSQLFVDKGVIVMTRGSTQRLDTAGRGDGSALLGAMPVVVLVNRGSASASEIVSGALQYYGNRGDIKTVVLGQRSYGKGSVQQVLNLQGGRAMMKLTSQYYLLPDQRVIHRKPGSTAWGVDPNLTVEMLPQQIADGLTLRKNADVLPGDKDGADPAASNPDELFAKNLDLQLEAARVLLQTQIYGKGVPQANAQK